VSGAKLLIISRKKTKFESKIHLFAELILDEQKKVSKIRKRLNRVVTLYFLTTFERMSSDSPISRSSRHKVRDFDADSFCLGSEIITRWHSSDSNAKCGAKLRISRN
jgi:hypothetical protein